MIVLGLTGSVGMGKSVAAKLCRQLGAAVFEADAYVHDLLNVNGAAVSSVAEEFPETLVQTHAGNLIDRKALGAIVFADEKRRVMLEEILHPMVRAGRFAHELHAEHMGKEICVHDIPLLFETGDTEGMEAIMVVTAPAHVQRARVMGRKGMTEERFKAILDAQMPDAEKRARADYIIHTGLGKRHTLEQLKAVFREVSR